MSTNLVQVGTKLFVDPKAVTAVYETEPYTVLGETHEGHVYVSFGEGFNKITRNTDWTLNQVKDALGLPLTLTESIGVVLDAIFGNVTG